MKTAHRFTWFLLAGLCVCGSALGTEPAVRTFKFNYGATLKDLPRDADVRVWIPVPPSNEYQTVKQLKADLPGESSQAAEETFGNQILYFKPDEAGDVDFHVSYLVKREEALGLSQPTKQELTPRQRKLFLAANELVPLEGKPKELLAELTLTGSPLEIGKRLYLRVDEHVKYDKSKPGYGHGDAAWVCDSRFGNCTDFHSLFISFARMSGLPARFEIGFPLPSQRGTGKIGGYHCWALFHVAGHGWVPVDISEADKHPEMKDYYFGNLTENRVTFTTGRDIDLVPKQKGPPLNYFVYPYVEVNGQPWPLEKIELAFSYRDQ